LEILLPELVKGTSEKYLLEAQFSVIKNKAQVIDLISKHPEFRINCSIDQTFNESEFQQLQLESNEEIFEGQNLFNNLNCSYIKIELPEIEGFQISNMELLLNTTNVVNESNIYTINSLEKVSNNSFKVTGKQPSMIFKINQASSINSIQVKTRFGQ
jgi:hypothetical protein